MPQTAFAGLPLSEDAGNVDNSGVSPVAGSSDQLLPLAVICLKPGAHMSEEVCNQFQKSLFRRNNYATDKLRHWCVSYWYESRK